MQLHLPLPDQLPNLQLSLFEEQKQREGQTAWSWEDIMVGIRSTFRSCSSVPDDLLAVYCVTRFLLDFETSETAETNICNRKVGEQKGYEIG